MRRFKLLLAAAIMLVGLSVASPAQALPGLESWSLDCRELMTGAGWACLDINTGEMWNCLHGQPCTPVG